MSAFDFITRPLQAETLAAFYDVEISAAQNWLSWCLHTFSEDYIRRTPVLLRQRDEARALIAEKCAPWFEVQS